MYTITTEQENKDGRSFNVNYSPTLGFLKSCSGSLHTEFIEQFPNKNIKMNHAEWHTAHITSQICPGIEDIAVIRLLLANVAQCCKIQLSEFVLLN